MPGQESCRVRSEKTDEADESGHTDSGCDGECGEKKNEKTCFRTDTPSMRASSSRTESTRRWRWSRKTSAEEIRMITTGNGIFDAVTPERLPMIQYSIEASCFPDLP